MKGLLKAAKIIFGFILICIVAVIIFEKTYSYSKQVKYGISFSPRYARYLKLDWEKTYIRILDELRVRNIRIPSYWISLEPDELKYDFAETDFMLDEASKRGIRVILVVGARQPRWPECHLPNWAKRLSVRERHQATLKFIQGVVERYKDSPAGESIWAWQVENEPFAFWFGQNCDQPDKKFLQAEISLVKKLDPKRPIILTDSGEWGDWMDPLALSDMLGISLYRRSYNPAINLYMTYPFLPGMYQLKAALIKNLSNTQEKKIIISELQVEPWVQKGVPDTDLEEQIKLFSLQDFKDIIEYTQRTGFDEAYLWGVEWWYWIAQQGHPEYLDFAKQLFK